MFKQDIFNHCYHLLEQKIDQLKQELGQLAESVNTETKSTAGDKHETGRAMMQLEQEKIGLQLKEAIAQMEALKQIDITLKSDSVIKGSLVECEQGYFFVASAIGKIIAGGKTVFAISPQSPLGAKLMGLRKQERAEMNGISYLVRNIV